MMGAALAPLRRRDFRLLLAGQSVSWIGNNFYEIAVMWLVLTLTGSTAAMAGVAAVSTLPQLIFGPFAGVVADRVNRRILALAMDFARGIVILVLPTLALMHHLAVWQVYVSAFILFTLFTFFLPARQAMLPNLVSDEELPAANGLFQATLYLSFLIGFGLGGLLVASVGVVPALYLDAVTFGVSMLTLLLIRSSGRERKTRERPRHSAVRETLLGMQFIFRQSTLLTIFAFNGAVGLLIGPLLILPAPFSRSVLHAGAHGYGLLEASFMAGSVVGAIGATVAAKVRHVGWMMVGVVIGGGLLLAALSYTRVLPAAMACNMAVGGVASILEVPIMTLIQRRTPDEMRGRVLSSMMMVNTAGTPISVAFAGVVAQIVGVAALYRLDGLAFVAMGLICLGTPLIRLRSDAGPEAGESHGVGHAGTTSSASDPAPV